eukprot:359660-Chlamydomonas_euryale.AAC.12
MSPHAHTLPPTERGGARRPLGARSTDPRCAAPGPTAAGQLPSARGGPQGGHAGGAASTAGGSAGRSVLAASGGLPSNAGGGRPVARGPPRTAVPECARGRCRVACATDRGATRGPI